MGGSYVVVDLGAASGRVMLARAHDDAMTLVECHRFANTPVQWPGGLYWNLPELYQQAGIGIGAAVAAAMRWKGEPPTSLGTATWGVDFGLVDPNGRVLGLPGHYRDGPAGLLDRVDQDEAYRITGIAPQSINTLPRLLDERLDGVLAVADELMMMPDLFGYLLTGRRGGSEYTIASTTQLVDPEARQWSAGLIDRYRLPRRLFPPLRESGHMVGTLRPAVCPEQPAAADVSVVTAAGHDTASALVGTPARTEHFAFISCGTWALVGLELPAPVRAPDARRAGFTNEGGVDGTTRFLRNVTGLWLLDESIRAWRRQGLQVSAADALAAAADVPAGGALVDPADPMFVPPGDMPARVADFCRRSGQPVPESVGALTRCVVDSLAAAFSVAVDSAASLAQRRVDVIHIVGGGSRAELLCQLTADLSGRPVVAGPAEATALGNALLQARASGGLDAAADSVTDLRALAARSVQTTTYQPAAGAGHSANGTGALMRRFADVTGAPLARRHTTP